MQHRIIEILFISACTLLYVSYISVRSFVPVRAVVFLCIGHTQTLTIIDIYADMYIVGMDPWVKKLFNP